MMLPNIILPFPVSGELAGSVIIKKAPSIVAPPNKCSIAEPPLLELPLSKNNRDKKQIDPIIAVGLCQVITRIIIKNRPPIKKLMLIHSQPTIAKLASLKILLF